MNKKYQLILEILQIIKTKESKNENIIQELKFKRHRFFHAEKSAARMRKEVQRIRNKNAFQQRMSIQKSRTRATEEKLKRNPQVL